MHLAAHLLPSRVVSRPLALLAAAGCFLGLALGARADLIQNASTLRGGSFLDWSSDLGRDWSQNIEPGYGNDGTVTPPQPENYDFAGQNVLTTVSRFGASSTLFVEPAANGPAEGAISHVRIENTVPDVGMYGLAARSAVNDTVWFSGAAGIPSTVFYAYAWVITSTLPTVPPGGYGPSVSSDVRFGAAESFGDAATGARFGSFGLAHGDGRNSFDGDGGHTVGVELGLFNPAGSPFAGGTVTLDLWYTFSNSEITHFEPPVADGSASVPETAPTLGLLGLAMGGLIAARRKGGAARAGLLVPAVE